MHVADMRRREDFAAITAATLAKGWSHQFGDQVVVTPGRTGAWQSWRERRPFGAFCVDRPAATVRRFLLESFRSTPALWRRPAQWTLGTVAATPLGLRMLAGEEFSVVPSVPDGQMRLMLPGNLRLRIFDFSSGTVRVLSKIGFANERFQREIAVRGNGATGPFPPITAADERAGWFEEPIVDGYSLPRCPARMDHRALAREALAKLDAWSAPSAREVAAGDRAAGLVNLFNQSSGRVAARFGHDLVPLLGDMGDMLSEAAGRAGRMVTTIGHGDCQPGNIFVARNRSPVLLLDWEHSSRRSAAYDRLVFGLSSRSPRGLASRVERFVDGETPAVLTNIPRDRSTRAALTAMLVLEDLVWYVEESLAAKFRSPSQGLLQYGRELPGITSALIPFRVSR